MQKTVLTPTQINFLSLFGQEKLISEKFYLSGGTALCEFYIPYRLSDDLDFFSENEVDIEEVVTFIRSIKNRLKFNSFDIQTSFNRNLIFLDFQNEETLKTEFTFYPFIQIETPKIVNGIKIDSIVDIAVNKLFTIYQKPRSRDFIDLYMIVQKEGFRLDDLIKKASVKFDWSIDYIQLGTQFLESKELKDYPRLLTDLSDSDWQDFFIEEAKKFKDKIIKN